MNIDKKLIILIFGSLVIISVFIISFLVIFRKPSESTPKDEFTITNSPSYSVSAADKSGVKTMKITSSGTLTFNKPIKITELLIVGGGGGGGFTGIGTGGGGGGGGQVVTQKNIPFSGGKINITIGAGAYTAPVGWTNTAEASKVTNGGNTSVTLNGKTYTAKGGKTALAPTGDGAAPPAKGGSGDGKGDGGSYDSNKGSRDGISSGYDGYGGGGGAGGISIDDTSIFTICRANMPSASAGRDGGGNGAGWGGDAAGADGSPNTGGGGGGGAAITTNQMICQNSRSGRGADGVVIIKYTLA